MIRQALKSAENVLIERETLVKELEALRSLLF